MPDLSKVAPSGADDRFEREERRTAQQAVASQLPSDARSVSLIILTLLAIVFTLYVAKEIVLPIVLAVVLKLLAQPAIRVLTQRLRLPSPLAALLIVIAVFGAIAAVGFAISLPASNWMAKAPETFGVLQQKLQVLREPIEHMQHALKQIEGGAGSGGESASGQSVTVHQGSGIAGYLATGTATTLSRFFTTIVVLFFLLAAGDRLLRGLVEVLPNFGDKRQAVEIAAEIETNIAGYLLTITIMNTLVGVATGTAMYLCGLGDPLLWGVAAFILNYIPILGPMTGVVMFFVVGLLTYQSPWNALIPAGAYLLIHVAEGETVTPMLLAKRFTLNPVLVIVSLFFWHTIWGIPGAFLAVPILAITKILCDRIDRLTPIGHIIGS